MYLADTNIIIRYLVKDHPLQTKACTVLFNQSRIGQVNLVITSLVIFETVWTLLSLYRVSKQQIVELLIELLKLEFIQIENRKLFIKAFEIWKTKNIDFNDAYNYIWAKESNLEGIYTFDKHFDKLKDLPRLEP